MVILGIDTSGARCDAALIAAGADEPVILAQSTLAVRYAHSERLIGLIEEVLNKAGMDRTRIEAVAVSIGPGSFTGLRVGLSTAKGLCFGLDIPLAAVPTPDAIAKKLSVTGKPLYVLLTARKEEYYFAEYVDAARSGDILVLPTQECLARIKSPCALACDQVPQISQIDQVELLDANIPLADTVAVMGYKKIINKELEVIETLVPLYVQAFKGVMG